MLLVHLRFTLLAFPGAWTCLSSACQSSFAPFSGCESLVCKGALPLRPTPLIALFATAVSGDVGDSFIVPNPELDELHGEGGGDGFPSSSESDESAVNSFSTLCMLFLSRLTVLCSSGACCEANKSFIEDALRKMARSSAFRRLSVLGRCGDAVRRGLNGSLNVCLRRRCSHCVASDGRRNQSRSSCSSVRWRSSFSTGGKS